MKALTICIDTVGHTFFCNRDFVPTYNNYEDDLYQSKTLCGTDRDLILNRGHWTVLHNINSKVDHYGLNTRF
jgi:hypothetical protein